jgi:hypothetical protein
MSNVPSAPGADVVHAEFPPIFEAKFVPGALFAERSTPMRHRDGERQAMARDAPGLLIDPISNRVRDSPAWSRSATPTDERDGAPRAGERSANINKG